LIISFDFEVIGLGTCGGALGLRRFSSLIGSLCPLPDRIQIDIRF